MHHWQVDINKKDVRLSEAERNLTFWQQEAEAVQKALVLMQHGGCMCV